MTPTAARYKQYIESLPRPLVAIYSMLVFVVSDIDDISLNNLLVWKYVHKIV